MINTASSDVSIMIKIKMKNTGDAVWLSGIRRWGGYVTLGIKLQDANGVEIEYGRELLPKDVAPGEAVVISTSLKSPAKKGSYKIKFDMVCEGMTWFEHVGSVPILMDLEVQ
jgi:hypothetical protein